MQRRQQSQNRFRTALANLSRLLPRSSPAKQEDMEPFGDPLTEAPPPAPPPSDYPMECTPQQSVEPIRHHLENGEMVFSTPETTLSPLPRDTPDVPLPSLTAQPFRLPSIVHVAESYDRSPLHYHRSQHHYHRPEFSGLLHRLTPPAHFPENQPNTLPSMYQQQSWNLPPVTTLPQPHTPQHVHQPQTHPSHAALVNDVPMPDFLRPTPLPPHAEPASHERTHSPSRRYSRLARMAREARERDARHAEMFHLTDGRTTESTYPTTTEQELEQLKRLIEGHSVQPLYPGGAASSAVHAAHAMPPPHRTHHIQRGSPPSLRGRRDGRHRARRGGAMPTGKLPKHPAVPPQIQPSLQQPIRRPSPRQSRQRFIRILNLAQAPATWYGSVAIVQDDSGDGVTEVKVPVAAFSYTLRTKSAFTASLPSVVKLGKGTTRKFDDVVDRAAGGGFLVRFSPVNDYGQTVVNNLYAGFVRECLLGGNVHEIDVEGGNVLLFPLMFPQVGLCFVGIFVAS